MVKRTSIVQSEGSCLALARLPLNRVGSPKLRASCVISRTSIKAGCPTCERGGRNGWFESDTSDAQYRRPELAGARRNFVSPQVMVEERYLYDPETASYTVDRYLND